MNHTPHNLSSLILPIILIFFDSGKRIIVYYEEWNTSDNHLILSHMYINPLFQYIFFTIRYNYLLLELILTIILNQSNTIDPYQYSYSIINYQLSKRITMIISSRTLRYLPHMFLKDLSLSSRILIYTIIYL